MDAGLIDEAPSLAAVRWVHYLVSVGCRGSVEYDCLPERRRKFINYPRVMETDLFCRGMRGAAASLGSPSVSHKETDTCNQCHELSQLRAAYIHLHPRGQCSVSGSTSCGNNQDSWKYSFTGRFPVKTFEAKACCCQYGRNLRFRADCISKKQNRETWTSLQSRCTGVHTMQTHGWPCLWLLGARARCQSASGESDILRKSGFVCIPFRKAGWENLGSIFPLRAPCFPLIETSTKGQGGHCRVNEALNLP